jgi:predicted permease
MILEILGSVILPIFLLIGLGALVERAFRLDQDTLSKLNFYVFVPALSFIILLDANLSAAQMGSVGLFSLAHAAALFALAWGVGWLPALRQHRTPIALGAILYNIGNYGIPLTVLAFGKTQVGIVAIVIVVQNLLTFTLGVWLMEHRVRGTARAALLGMLKLPILYAIALALLLRAFHVTLPAPVRAPLDYLADGLIPLALLTLGAQLARTRLGNDATALAAITVLRLLVSPLLAFLLVRLFGISGVPAQVLIVAAGFPVAVNLTILAAEYRQDEALAAQSIFLTTLLSSVTVAVLILLVR